MNASGSFATTYGVCLALGVALAGSGSAAECERRVALLQGAQQVPPVASNALGCATFLVDPCQDTVTYYIVFHGLAGGEVGAEISGPAGPGVLGVPVHPLPPGSPKIGVWNYPAAFEPDILLGNFYVNIRSAGAPLGELRGQIVTHVAVIDNLQETPPNASGGRGWAVGNLDRSAGTLRYHIVFGGLGAPETVAHIHGPQVHTLGAAPPLHNLAPGSPKIGVWAYNAVDEPAIIDGAIYINIHSTAFPGGEIRGQFTPIVTPLDPIQEVPPPPVVSAAAGCALISIDRANNRLGYDIVHSGLSSPENNAHFHGYVRRNVGGAGVVHPLVLGPRKLGLWNYLAADELRILQGLSYINIHSVLAPAGEIRGQVELSIRPMCVGDVNCDGFVDLDDLLLVLACLNVPAACPGQGDVDGNGVCDLNDLLFVLGSLGTPCPV